MVIKTSVKFESSNFERRLSKMIRGIEDLSPILKVIGQSWYKTNKSFFLGKNTDLYADLSEKYKQYKQKNYGFIYPIMFRRGELMRSLTNPQDSNAIAKIINKKTLILGTKVPYASIHQEGTQFIPRRPTVILNPKNNDEDRAVSRQRNRSQAYLNMIENYIREQAQ